MLQHRQPRRQTRTIRLAPVLIPTLILTLALALATPATADEGAPVVDICDLPLITRVEPLFPSRAAARGLEGSVLLTLLVQPTGLVTDVALVESSPPVTFDRAAIRAVERWRFAPNAERPVTRTFVQIEFRLEPEDIPLGPCDPDRLFKDGFED